MIGIDHNIAAVDIREKFSFTKSAASAALDKLKSYENVSGCLLISTCNRMELWASCSDNSLDITQFLADEKNLEKDYVEEMVIRRHGEDAVRHLFYLSGGLKSMIVGDDQILTQLKDALANAREMESTDSYIEVLFRMAISAGKRIRNEVSFDKGNRSAAALAVSYLNGMGYSFNNKKCLVIGNGEMGKLAATNLKEAGADVTVTVRQYRSGIVCIPKGCRRVDYGDRYKILPECDYVFSATSSPNLTITVDKLCNIDLKQNTVFVDLAVPRDIDCRITRRGGIVLYDIDSLKIDKVSERMEIQLAEAKSLLEQDIKSFLAEQSSRLQLKNIQNTGTEFGEEVAWRVERQFRTLTCSSEEKAIIYELVKSNSDKVMQKFLFSLQKGLSPKEFNECMKIFKSVL